MARSIKVEGLEQLQAKLKALQDRTSIENANSRIRTVVSEASDIVAKETESRARSVGLPRDAQSDVFAYHRPKPGEKQATALAGVRKRGRQIGSGIQNKSGVRKWAGAGYREWFGGNSWAAVPGGYLKGGGKRSMRRGLKSGRLIGESLATMWEKGTSKMRARPFFRPAITSVRVRVVQHISNGFKRILETL